MLTTKIFNFGYQLNKWSLVALVVMILFGLIDSLFFEEKYRYLINATGSVVLFVFLLSILILAVNSIFKKDE